MKNTFLLIVTCLVMICDAGAQIIFGKEYPFFGNRAMNVELFSRPDGFIMATAAPLHVNDYYLTLIKTDLDGDTLWVKQHDVGIYTNYASVVGDTDPAGNMYISITNAEYNLVKVSPDGDILWQKYHEDMLGGALYGNDFLWACFREYGSDLCYLYKINPANGGAAWRTEIFNGDGYPCSMAIKEDGEMAVMVFNEFVPTTSSMLYIKPADSSAFLPPVFIDLPYRYVPCLRYNGDELCGMAQYPSNGVPFDDNKFIRFLTSGEIILEQPFSFNAIASGVNNMIINNQQAIIICNAYLNNDADSTILLSMDMNGEILWQHTLPDIDYALGLEMSADGGYVVSGHCRHIYEGSPYLYKTDPQGVVAVKKTPSPTSQMKAFPNPANGTVTFEVPGMQNGEIRISNLYGSQITQISIADGHAIYNTSCLDPGIYVFSTEDGLSGKLVVL